MNANNFLISRRIAIISDHGDPAAETGVEEAGGQSVYVRQLGETLPLFGWYVDIFTRKINRNDATIVQHSSYCRTIRLIAGPEKFIPRDEIFDYMPEFVEAFEIFRQNEGIYYPVIHTNYWLSAWVGLQLKKLSSINLIHTYLSLGVVKYETILKYQTASGLPKIAATRLEVERQILEQADYVIANSPQEKEDFHTLVSQKGHVEIIPLGTDIDCFHPTPKSEARKILGLPSTERIILYVGRFDPRKGIETLVRACAQLKAQAACRFKLVVVGGSCPERIDELEYQRIKQIVEEVGLTEFTLFAGRIDHSKLVSYYSSADVCVIPSYYEPFGLVAIESMACSTPVIASEVGGLKYTVVHEQTGLLVPPGNIGALSEAIKRVLENKAWAMELGINASKRVRHHFALKETVGKLSGLYQRLLNKSVSKIEGFNAKK